MILATKKCRIYAAFGVSQTPRKENYMKRIVAYAMPVILAFRKRLVNVKGKGLIRTIIRTFCGLHPLNQQMDLKLLQ